MIRVTDRNEEAAGDFVHTIIAIKAFGQTSSMLQNNSNKIETRLTVPEKLFKWFVSLAAELHITGWV